MYDKFGNLTPEQYFMKTDTELTCMKFYRRILITNRCIQPGNCWRTRQISCTYKYYVSVNSKPDHLPSPGDPGDSHIPLPGGSRFWIGEIFYSFERKMQELLDLLQRNRKQVEKQVFLCCFISIFAKTADVYCICNNMDHFWSFWSFW